MLDNNIDIHSQKQLIQILRTHTLCIGDFERFTKYCHELEQHRYIKIHKIHPYVTPCWYHICYFNNLHEYDNGTRYFLLYREPFMAVGRLNEKTYKNHKKYILDGKSHAYATDLDFKELNYFLPLREQGIYLLSGSLLNQDIHPSTSKIMQAEKLIGPYIWTWNPQNIGQLLFNWWDD